MLAADGGGGGGISRSGWEKRVAREAACALVGVRASRFVGRLERGSCEVGIDSGIGSDIFRRGWGLVVVLGGRVGWWLWLLRCEMKGGEMGWLEEEEVRVDKLLRLW